MTYTAVPMSAGDTGRDDCASQCTEADDCSGIEWHVDGVAGIHCHRIPTSPRAMRVADPPVAPGVECWLPNELCDDVSFSALSPGLAIEWKDGEATPLASQTSPDLGLPLRAPGLEARLQSHLYTSLTGNTQTFSVPRSQCTQIRTLLRTPDLYQADIAQVDRDQIRLMVELRDAAGNVQCETSGLQIWTSLEHAHLATVTHQCTGAISSIVIKECIQQITTFPPQGGDFTVKGGFSYGNGATTFGTAHAVSLHLLPSGAEAVTTDGLLVDFAKTPKFVGETLHIDISMALLSPRAVGVKGVDLHISFDTDALQYQSFTQDSRWAAPQPTVTSTQLSMVLSSAAPEETDTTTYRVGPLPLITVTVTVQGTPGATYAHALTVTSTEFLNFGDVAETPGATSYFDRLDYDDANPATSASLHVDVDAVVGIFAYMSDGNHMLVNAASLTGTTSNHNLRVDAYRMWGSTHTNVEPSSCLITSTIATCNVQQKRLELSSSHMIGGSTSVSVTWLDGATTHNANLDVTVLLPTTPSLAASDLTLTLIGDCTSTFQRARLQVFDDTTGYEWTPLLQTAGNNQALQYDLKCSNKLTPTLYRQAGRTYYAEVEVTGSCMLAPRTMPACTAAML